MLSAPLIHYSMWLIICRWGQDDLLWDEPEQSAQPSAVHSQPLEDDLAGWACLTSEPDQRVTTTPKPDLVDEIEDDRLRGSGEQTALKTPPAPRQRAGSAGADAWASRRGDSVRRGGAPRGAPPRLQRDPGTPRKSGWTTSGDDYSGVHIFVFWNMAPWRQLSIDFNAVTHQDKMKQWNCPGHNSIISQVKRSAWI